MIVADARFASSLQRLRDAANAGFPNLREFAVQGGEANIFLKDHPCISAAVFVSDATWQSLESLGVADRHRDGIASAASRSRGFVYAASRGLKSYEFVFVAADPKTMDDLVQRFTALAELAPGHEGVLVELPK